MSVHRLPFRHISCGPSARRRPIPVKGLIDARLRGEGSASYSLGTAYGGGSVGGGCVSTSTTTIHVTLTKIDTCDFGRLFTDVLMASCSCSRHSNALFFLLCIIHTLNQHFIYVASTGTYLSPLSRAPRTMAEGGGGLDDVARGSPILLRGGLSGGLLSRGLRAGSEKGSPVEASMSQQGVERGSPGLPGSPAGWRGVGGQHKMSGTCSPHLVLLFFLVEGLHCFCESERSPPFQKSFFYCIVCVV